LTLQSDFALRTLMYLAAHQQRATIGGVAQCFGISAAHVAKVANQLARLGLVRSIRGIGGGMELARAPDQIRVGEVITMFEGRLNLLDCVTTDGVCAIESLCKLKGVLAEAERLQMQYLNSVTLADVMPTKRQMARVQSGG
jgi:Rrf2 family nitric oxide-sensitive transcriptional repressor